MAVNKCVNCNKRDAFNTWLCKKCQDVRDAVREENRKQGKIGALSLEDERYALMKARTR
jgi:hypothetical protein